MPHWAAGSDVAGVFVLRSRAGGSGEWPGSRVWSGAGKIRQVDRHTVTRARYTSRPRLPENYQSNTTLGGGCFRICAGFVSVRKTFSVFSPRSHSDFRRRRSHLQRSPEHCAMLNPRRPTRRGRTYSPRIAPGCPGGSKQACPSRLRRYPGAPSDLREGTGNAGESVGPGPRRTLPGVPVSGKDLMTVHLARREARGSYRPFAVSQAGYYGWRGGRTTV